MSKKFVFTEFIELADRTIRVLPPSSLATFPGYKPYIQARGLAQGNGPKIVLETGMRRYFVQACQAPGRNLRFRQLLGLTLRWSSALLTIYATLLMPTNDIPGASERYHSQFPVRPQYTRYAYK